MIDTEKREKVIRGLESCLRLCDYNACRECPYGDGTPCKLLHDALALLKEQEPRVMTLEEVRNLKYDDVVYYQGINTNSVESAIVLHGEKMVPEVNTRVVQFRHADRTGGWNGINNADLNGYGKKWRCWTSRPTLEQMRETKWEADNETVR
jgi:hypothetical protein